MNGYSKLDADRIMARLTRLAGYELGTHTRRQVQTELARGMMPRVVEARMRRLFRETDGIIQRTLNREYDVWVSIYDATRSYFDPEGGRYVTVCDKHGSICNHETLYDAKRHAPGLEWCEECQENLCHPNHTFN